MMPESPFEETSRGAEIGWTLNLGKPKPEQDDWDRWLTGYQRGHYEEEAEEMPDHSITLARNRGDLMVRNSQGRLVSSLDFFKQEHYVASPPVPCELRRKRDLALLRHKLDQSYDNNILDAHCQQAKNLFKAEFAAISLAQLDSDYFQILGASGCGLEGLNYSPLPRSASLCSHAFLLGDRSAVIRNRSKDWRLKDFNFAPHPDYHKQSSLGFNFYASSPLMLSAPGLEGKADIKVQIGRFCIMDLDAREDFSEKDIAQLEAISKMASDKLEREWESRRATKLYQMQRATMDLARQFHSKVLSITMEEVENDAGRKMDLEVQRLFQTYCEQACQQLGASGVACFTFPFVSEENPRRRESVDLISRRRQQEETSDPLESTKVSTPLVESFESQCTMTNEALKSNLEAKTSVPKRSYGHSKERKSESSSTSPLFASAGDCSHLPQKYNKSQLETIRKCFLKLSSGTQAAKLNPVEYKSKRLRDDYSQRYKDENCKDEVADLFIPFLPENTGTFVVLPIWDLDTMQSSYLTIVFWPNEYLFEDWDRNFLISSTANLQGACLRRKTLESFNAETKFMRLITHELRTPLHGIIGMSTQLQQCLQGEQVDKTDMQVANASHGIDLKEATWLSKGIQFAGEDLRRILDDTLEYGRLNIGMLMPLPIKEAVDMSIVQIVEASCQDELVARAARKTHSKESSHDLLDQMTLSLPMVLIHADMEIERAILTENSAKVRNVIDQFISNAIRFSKADSEEEYPIVQVSIGLSNKASDSRPDIHGNHRKEELAIKIKIEDNGIGMKADFLRALAEPFKKADTFHQGAGIGVALGCSMLDRMGGSMEVSSIENRGTCVTLALKADSILEREPSRATITSTTVQKAVLINFDPIRDAKIRRMMIRYLASRNIQVIDEAEGIQRNTLILFFHDARSKASEAKLQVLSREVCSTLKLVIFSRSLELDLAHYSHAPELDSPWIYFCPNPLGPSALNFLDGFVKQNSSRVRSRNSYPRNGSNNEADYVELAMSPLSASSTAASLSSAFSPSEARLRAESLPGSRSPLPQESPTKSPISLSPNLSPKSERKQLTVEKDSSFSVLIVEDNPINMQLLEACVKKTKCRYSKAVNGAEAVEKYKKMCPHGPSVVLLDISMPIMDGLEASKAMRFYSAELMEKQAASNNSLVPQPDHRNCRIIAITALSSQTDIEKGSKFVDEWRIKPSNLPKLIKDLQRWKKEWQDVQ